MLPPSARKTYSISTPIETHWIPATCAQVDCAQYVSGWKSRIDERTEQGQAQARYIRFHSGRSFTEERDDVGMTVFSFAPGQMPFDDAQSTHSTHRIRRDDLPELYVVRGGDHRGNPRGDVTRLNGRAWSDDFGEHQEALADRLKRG
jgi:hypothetical protein